MNTIKNTWTAALLGLALACSSGSSGSTAPGADTVAPQFLTGPILSPGPNATVPLAALIELVTNEATRIKLIFDDGIDPVWETTAAATLQTDHDVPVLGMKPDRTYMIEVVAIDAAGNETTAGPFVFVTPPLPANFPPLQVKTAIPAAMEPGFTLFAARSTPIAPGARADFIVMLDEMGEVVWYYHDPAILSGQVQTLSNGNFIYVASITRTITEIDRLGNVVGKWHPTGWDDTNAPADATRVETDSFHHELFEMPESEEADFLTLSTELRVFDNYPSDVVDLTQTEDGVNVVGDTILEFKRDGTIVRETRLLDILDPGRLCYDSLFSFWDPWYGGASTRDWAHANAVFYDASDDTYVVSVRHQDAVVKIRRDTQEIVWILGDHARWKAPWQPFLLTPDGGPEFEWQYHQHAPQLNRLGNVVLFDNGNQRAIPPAEELPVEDRYSRAVEYRVNPITNQVKQVWHYGGPGEGWYSRFLGDARPMPFTNNVLIVDGGRSNADGSTFARLVEVTRRPNPQVVFEMEFNQPTIRNWTIYRAERVLTIYPFVP